MHKIAFALAFSACAGHGPRVRSPFEDLHKALGQDRSASNGKDRSMRCAGGICRPSRLQMFARYLLALSSSPAASFNPSASHTGSLLNHAVQYSHGHLNGRLLDSRSKQVVMNSSAALVAEGFEMETVKPKPRLRLQSARVKSAVSKKNIKALEAAYKLKPVGVSDSLTGKEEEQEEEEEEEEDDDYYDDDDDIDDEEEEMIVLTPKECSEKYDEMLKDLELQEETGTKSRRLDDFEVQALVFAIKKEHKWKAKRDQVNEQRRKKKTRRVTDSSFAKILKLPGGRQEYLDEMHRVSHARQMLLDGMIGLIKWTVNRFRHLSLTISHDDLYRVGQDYLVKAALKHDPRLGFKLSTLAVVMMKHAMIHEIGERGKTIRIPQSVQYEYLKNYKLSTTLVAEGYDKDEANEVVLQSMEVSEKRLGRVNRMMTSNQVGSMNENMKTGKSKTEEGSERSHFVADPSSAGTALRETMKKDMTQAEVVRVLDALLTPKEAAILKKRYGFDCPQGTEMPLQDVATEMNMTPEQTRQLERIGLVKLLPI